MHNEKQKSYTFFVVQDGGLAMMGMPNIDKLSLVSFTCKKIGGQVAVDDITENCKRNSQCEGPIQTESRKCNQFEREKQDAEA